VFFFFYHPHLSGMNISSFRGPAHSPFALATSLRLVCALAFTGGAHVLPAQEPSPADFETPSWSTLVTASLAAGYRDNLLLSPTNAESSALLRAELDIMALKVPVGNLDGFVYLNLTEDRYLSGERTDHERTAILAGEARWQRSTAFKAGWTVQAYHMDQVLDVSVTETELSTAQLQVTGFVTGPNIRWNFAPAFLEAKITGRRDTYRRDVDGYFESEGFVRVGATFGRHEFGLGTARRLRDHESRPQFTISGRPIAGSILETRQTDALADWTMQFGENKQGRVATSVGRQWSRDNGSGYFNFHRDIARTRFHWKSEAWEHELGLEYNRYEFSRQFVGIGINPDLRYKRELRGSWEVTRQLGRKLAAFLVVQHERSSSNDERSRFTVQTIYAGVKASWDSLDRWLE
jgi:hypothetical protein